MREANERTTGWIIIFTKGLLLDLAMFLLALLVWLARSEKGEATRLEARGAQQRATRVHDFLNHYALLDSIGSLSAKQFILPGRVWAIS